MKILTIIDESIDFVKVTTWQSDFSSFITKHTGIKPEFRLQHEHVGDYPTYIDGDGDIRPTKLYLKSLVNEEYDHIFLFIHKENWKSDPPGPGNGIWGTNYSYSLGDVHLHYCRWDTRKANTFGTSYHEWMHALDTLIKVELGEDINFDGKWDSCAVHGRCDSHQYIRYQENTELLPPIADQLKRAYMKRRVERLKKKVSLLQTILLLTKRLRMIFNQKNGVPRST